MWKKNRAQNISEFKPVDIETIISEVRRTMNEMLVIYATSFHS